MRVAGLNVHEIVPKHHPAADPVGGDADVPVAVLLHGQPGRWDRLAALGRCLARTHRVLLPDRPGYGETGGAAVGVRANGHAVVELLDALELERVVVVGHSYGSLIALALGQDAPARIEGLGLIGAVHPGRPVGLVDRVLASGPAGAVLSRTGVGRSFFVEQVAWTAEVGSLAGRLDEVRAPTVIVNGALDPVTPARDARALAEDLPDARYVEIARGGHLLPILSPQRVADALGVPVAA